MQAKLPPIVQSAQRYRRQRTLLALAFYTLCGLVIGFGAWQGFYPWYVVVNYTILYLVVTAVFLAITLLGWNLRFQEPSLTEPQIVCAILICSYTLIHAGPFRGVFLFAYVIAIMFGAGNLTTQQLTRLGLLPVLLFPGIAVLAARQYPGSVDWRVEVVYWFSLCVILIFLALLVGKLIGLRIRLKTSNAELQAALAKLTELAVHD
jgi:hypothetical protein